MRKTEREIDYSAAFKRDYKKLKHSSADLELLDEILNLLVWDKKLPERAHDHALGGQWLDHRECHIKPDLLLIYKKSDQDTLKLARLGSHASLFG
ncbi:MAG: type II toxin-antitoxin system YafQ family toxin [Holophagales bacterium]|jgi:mRNA interferase YafQ|nr:type II toxin-antitoxin system YafQ family toxin [Holophagales bacterium]